MEKIQFNFKQLKNRKVLSGGKIITVKQLIPRSETIGIISSCLDNYFSDSSGVDMYSYLGEIKTLFNILVLSACTNIKVTGVEPTEIYESNIIGKIKRLVKNYDEVWGLVLNAIDYKNQHNSLNLIADSLPSDKRLGKTAKVIGEMISDLKQNNPALLNTVIDSAKLNANKELERKTVQRKNTELKKKSEARRNSAPQA